MDDTEKELINDIKDLLEKHGKITLKTMGGTYDLSKEQFSGDLTVEDFYEGLTHEEKKAELTRNVHEMFKSNEKTILTVSIKEEGVVDNLNRIKFSEFLAMPEKREEILRNIENTFKEQGKIIIILGSKEGSHNYTIEKKNLSDDLTLDNLLEGIALKVQGNFSGLIGSSCPMCGFIFESDNSFSEKNVLFDGYAYKAICRACFNEYEGKFLS